MAKNQLQAIDIDLHPQAERQAREYINQYATSLLLEAKLIAYRTRADAVLTPHVDEALDVLTNERKRSWSRELLIVLGGAFVGAFLQGFITELSSGNRPLVVIYTVLGFIGVFMVFLGLRR